MPFTDENLNQLKEFLKASHEMAVCKPKDILAVIARLEAAENVAERLRLSWEGESFKLVKAWRKASGK